MKYNWDKEIIESAIKNNYNYNDVLRTLNIPLRGNNRTTLKNKIKEYHIDISHFTFKSTSRKKRVINIEDYLSNKRNINTTKLRQKLIEAKLKENKCECCGITNWQNKPIVMQLHHIDGNDKNNNLRNLIILCPNCHSQTYNYRNNGNKIKKYCPDCGKEISHQSIHCKKCSMKYQQRTRKLIVSDEQLIEDKKKLKTNIAIGKKYNISDSYISRRFKIMKQKGMI